MAQLLAVMYGKFAIYFPEINCFGTFEIDFSVDKDLESDMFFDDLHLGRLLSIDILRSLFSNIS